MEATSRNRSVPVYVLLGLLIFLGLGGLYGGIILLADPSGGFLGVEVSLLASVPVSDFLIPGLILVTVFGILPLAAVYGLWTLAGWALLQELNPWRDYHWAWSWTRLIGVALMLWIGLEFLMWGNISPLQPILLAVSFGILIMTGYGSVKRYAWMGQANLTGLTTERADDIEDASIQ